MIDFWMDLAPNPSKNRLHLHLFPRFVDVPFPGGPIDYRKCTPSPYASQTEFLAFTGQLRITVDRLLSEGQPQDT